MLKDSLKIVTLLARQRHAVAIDLIITSCLMRVNHSVFIIEIASKHSETIESILLLGF